MSRPLIEKTRDETKVIVNVMNFSHFQTKKMLTNLLELLIPTKTRIVSISSSETSNYIKPQT